MGKEELKRKIVVPPDIISHIFKIMETEGDEDKEKLAIQLLVGLGERCLEYLSHDLNGQIIFRKSNGEDVVVFDIKNSGLLSQPLQFDDDRG